MFRLRVPNNAKPHLYVITGEFRFGVCTKKRTRLLRSLSILKYGVFRGRKYRVIKMHHRALVKPKRFRGQKEWKTSAHYYYTQALTILCIIRF